MASCLQIENLKKAYGARILFEGVTLSIEEGEKVALVAVNGAGKSSLLKIVAGEEEYQGGKITFRRDVRVGYLAQEPKFKRGITLLEGSFDADNEAGRAIAHYERALTSGEGLEEAMAAMDAAGAWDYEQQAKEILTRLELTQFDQPIEELSGGQLKRLALARVLIARPDLLILDEPTNHLDLEMIEWLEEWLTASRATLLMVTHDRYFLDRVCTRILEIDEQQLFSYRGNYSYYLEKRQERIDTLNATAEKTRNLYRRELEWIRRTPSARTGKAKYRIDAFEQLSEERRTVQTERQVEIGIEASRIGTKIFEMHHLTKHYDELCLLKDFSYTFSRGEKVGIVGRNGIGKSTFVKMLLGRVAPDSGRIEVGQTIRFGYYAQEGLQFKEEERVIDVVKRISEDITLSDGARISASQLLTRFLFTPATQYNPVSKLSGGERRRLYLCTVLIANPNFLILDEPTNDLDIQTLTVLEEYLASFKGCVIVISHDRYFMDKIADHLFVMQGGGEVKDFPGNYTQYRLWRKEQEAAAQLEEQQRQKRQAAPAPQKAQRSYADRLSFKERRELEALEAELPELERQKAALEAELSSGMLSPDKLQESSRRIVELMEEIELKTLRWMELSEKN